MQGLRKRGYNSSYSSASTSTPPTVPRLILKRMKEEPIPRLILKRMNEEPIPQLILTRMNEGPGAGEITLILTRMSVTGARSSVGRKKIHHAIPDRAGGGSSFLSSLHPLPILLCAMPFFVFGCTRSGPVLAVQPHAQVGDRGSTNG